MYMEVLRTVLFFSVRLYGCSRSNPILPLLTCLPTLSLSLSLSPFSLLLVPFLIPYYLRYFRIYYFVALSSTYPKSLLHPHSLASSPFSRWKKAIHTICALM